MRRLPTSRDLELGRGGTLRAGEPALLALDPDPCPQTARVIARACDLIQASLYGLEGRSIDCAERNAVSLVRCSAQPVMDSRWGPFLSHHRKREAIYASRSIQGYLVNGRDDRPAPLGLFSRSGTGRRRRDG